MGAKVNAVARRAGWAGSVTAVILRLFKSGAAWLRMSLAMALLATSGCAWLDVKQRQVIYRPTPGMPTEFSELRAGDERYFVTVPQAAGQRVEIWWLPHANKNAPTLLYLHGTFRTLFENLHKIEALRNAGFAVLAVDYRGWGQSTPITPSEQTIMQDAAVAWAELQQREPRAGQRVIYGHSMGTGVAVDLASGLRARSDYGALILESAFTSFPDVAREAGLLAQFLVLLNNERFASVEKISRVQAPLLMIHGGLDTTIPIQLGKALFAAANPPKRWITIEDGAHSDLDQVGQAQYHAALRGFVRDYLAGP